VLGQVLARQDGYHPDDGEVEGDQRSDEGRLWMAPEMGSNRGLKRGWLRGFFEVRV
jgi:hypothetical protein